MALTPTPTPEVPARAAPLTAQPSWWWRAAPAVGLFLLAPMVGEWLEGNIALTRLNFLAVMAPLYGGGALLVREVARRTGRGWPTILLLGLAYAVIEEGLVVQTLFNPSAFGLDLLSWAHIPALGISAWWTLFVLTLHTVWSIGVSIALVEALVPDRRTEPWLAWGGLGAAAGLFVAGAIVVGRLTWGVERFVASPAQLVGAAVVAAALMAGALALPRRARPRVDRRAPRPLLVGTLGFVASTLFTVLGWLPGWFAVGVMLGLYALVIVMVAAWSRRADWGPVHVTALAGGALLTYAWSGFTTTPVIGAPGPADLVGNAVLALAAVALLVAAVRRAA